MPLSILNQIQGYIAAKSHKKMIQFSTLFQVLCDGRPMIEFLSRFKLYKFLVVPNLPHMHWSIGSAWLMAEHIWDLVKKCIIDLVKAARFIAVTTDETSVVNYTS